MLDFCHLDMVSDQAAPRACPSPGASGSRSPGRWPPSRSCSAPGRDRAGLNPTELDEAIDLIRKIRDSGITILIVEHIMKVIMTISDRILAINFGQTIAEGTPQEVANNRR